MGYKRGGRGELPDPDSQLLGTECHLSETPPPMHSVGLDPERLCGFHRGAQQQCSGGSSQTCRQQILSRSLMNAGMAGPFCLCPPASWAHSSFLYGWAKPAYLTFGATHPIHHMVHHLNLTNTGTCRPQRAEHTPLKAGGQDRLERASSWVLPVLGALAEPTSVSI